MGLKELAELFKFAIDKHRLLAALALVGTGVLGALRWKWVAIEKPYVYGAYVVVLLGFASGVYLIVAMIDAGVRKGRAYISKRSATVAADRRALDNLRTIDKSQAACLDWIKEKGEQRFSEENCRDLRDLVKHGFLEFDDPQTKHENKTYFKVRDAVWNEITSKSFNWKWNFKRGSTDAPWVARRRFGGRV